MYYILNETNQIIAADDNLLNLCGLSHIDELSLKLALGNINFDLSEEKIVITNKIVIQHLLCQKHLSQVCLVSSH